MNKTTDVLVIGGGIIGVTCAYELSQRGAQVTLIDKGEIGHGCSYGNAGWVTPCFAMPLPMPGMLLKSIGWLLDPESPLYIKPSLDPALHKWLFRFLRSMNQSLMLQSIEALVNLSKFSLEAYAQLNQKFPNSLKYHQNGLLMVSQTEAGLEAAAKELELVKPHGIPGSKLTETEVRQLEPALVGPLLGGVYFPTEAHLEPLSTIQTLTDHLIKIGVRILPKTELYDFVFENGKIKEVHSTKGLIKADQYVLATGSWSPEIAKKLALNIPVLGGKGYALILPPLDPSPKIPLMLVERKIAITPRSNSIRLAGTLELVDPLDYSITSRRVQAILKGAKLFLNLPTNPEVIELWRGLRPCTPDGVPVISYSTQWKNLLISTGHQMLGIQSAPGSAKLATDLLLNETPSFDPFPFRANRF